MRNMCPNLSAYSHVFGLFNYNRTPLVHPRTKIITHKKPDARKSWTLHGKKGWYVGPAMEYYRCYRVFIEET